MSQKQFEEFQSIVGLLSPQQLIELHNNIESKLEQNNTPLLTEDELDLISSLFH